MSMSLSMASKPSKQQPNKRVANETATDCIEAVIQDSCKTWQNDNVSLITAAAHPTAANLYEAMRNNKAKYGLHVPMPAHYSVTKKQRKAPPPMLEECKTFMKKWIAVKGKKQAIKHVTQMLKKGRMKPIDLFFNSK